MNVSDKRNLAEQVEKNKQDILKHFQRDEVLADFGIRIIGQLESPEELPESAAEYGDAYAVGTQSPFNYYIWTRANNISPVDYWFDFGEIAIAGPQGPKGDRGPQGETGKSTRWYLKGANWDFSSAGKQPGDMVLIAGSGQVYELGEDYIWGAQTNIRGPQGPAGKNGKDGAQGIPGPQGPQGPAGDVGGFINIAGVASSYEALPDPEVIGDLTVAYLVGTEEPYTLYVQVGSNSRVAEWLDAGPLNVATLVTVNGQYQNTWNADTKLDKISAPTSNNQAYVKSYNGAQSLVDISQTPSAWKIASYDGEGRLKTQYPDNDFDCANKGYVDYSQDWGSQEIEIDFDDASFINLKAESQYIVSGYMFVRYTPDDAGYGGYGGVAYLNFDTATIFIPSSEQIHDEQTVSSLAQLKLTNSPHVAFDDVSIIIGQPFQDGNVSVIDGTTYVSTQIYLTDPNSIYLHPVNITEKYINITFKRIY